MFNPSKPMCHFQSPSRRATYRSMTVMTRRMGQPSKSPRFKNCASNTPSSNGETCHGKRSDVFCTSKRPTRGRSRIRSATSLPGLSLATSMRLKTLIARKKLKMQMELKKMAKKEMQSRQKLTTKKLKRSKTARLPTRSSMKSHSSSDGASITTQRIETNTTIITSRTTPITGLTTTIATGMVI